MRQALRFSVIMAWSVLASATLTIPAFAQQQKAQQPNGPSDRLVRVLQGIAYDRMPPKVIIGKETVEIDKSDPKKFLIPLEDARAVIVIANRTASAALCDMNDAVSANFIALMNDQEGRKKWSREQLHMIKWIHNSVVMLRAENRDAGDPGTQEAPKSEPKVQDKEAGDITLSEAQQMMDISDAKERARKAGLCTEVNKAKLQKDIEEYVIAVNARLGNTVDKTVQ